MIAVAALGFGMASQAEAQALNGTLVEESGAPVQGAAVYVIDGAGRQVAAVLSDAVGHFQVKLEAVGTYSLRVERIGFETETVSQVDVPDQGTWEVRVPLRFRPLRIDPLQVTAERVCRSERNRNPALIRIWSEVRKGLAQTALASDDSARTYQVEMSERALDPEGALIRASADTVTLQGAHAFTFQGIDDLTESGWGQVREDGVTDLFGPSPEAFLSARFGATHCLSLGDRDGPGGKLGLDFASITDSLDVGMEGTFWIDPADWRLRRIDFRYTGTDLLESAEGQGGTVLLDVDDTGTWYASAWSIRGPLLEKDGTTLEPEGISNFVVHTRYRLTGYLEHAGRVIWPTEVAATVTSPWATSAALQALQPGADERQARALGQAIRQACAISPDDPLPAVVAGTVNDSISGVALPGARVRMEWQEPGDTATHRALARADDRGYYQFCDAPVGTQVAIVAEMRVSSTPVLVDVEAKMLHVEKLVLPLSDPTRPGLLVGRVIDAGTRKPVTNAEVRLDEKEEAVALTNEQGYFSLGRQDYGAYHLTVSALGYLQRKAPVRIQGGLTESVDVELSTEPIAIEGLDVSVRGRMVDHDMDALVTRMKSGWGTFVTRDLLEQRPFANVPELLREAPGIQVRFQYPGGTPYLQVRGRPCSPDVYVDGNFWPYGLDDLSTFHADELEAVEIYHSISSIPGIFFRSSNPPCAVVAVWTR